MNISIDTNIYSEMLKNNKTVLQLLENANTVFVSSIVLGELYFGFMNGSKSTENFKQLDNFLSTPGVEIIPVQPGISLRYARIVRDLKKIGKPIPTNDIWIAATAFDTGSHLFSFDDHFTYIPGLSLIDKNGTFS